MCARSHHGARREQLLLLPQSHPRRAHYGVVYDERMMVCTEGGGGSSFFCLCHPSPSHEQATRNKKKQQKHESQLGRRCFLWSLFLCCFSSPSSLTLFASVWEVGRVQEKTRKTHLSVVHLPVFQGPSIRLSLWQRPPIDFLHQISFPS